MNKQKISVISIVVFLSLFYLVLAAGYSQSYSPGFFPDEFAHMGYVIDVLKNNFPDYKTGLIYASNKYNYLNHPALYYLIVGELTKLFHLQDAFANVGRYVNTLISLIIIALTCRMLYQTTRSRLATFVGASFLLVIPMFALLGAAVSNDQINTLGCTLVIYGLVGLLDTDKDKKPLTSCILFICAGGIIASLTKATGSLAIVCMMACAAMFNFSRLVRLIRNLSVKQGFIIIASVAVVAVYFLSVHRIYGGFYPAPQGTPAAWFFVENPTATRLSFSDFLGNFLNGNLVTLTIPYGHIYIADSESRIAIVKSILLMLAVMAGYVSLKKYSKNKSYFTLTFSLVLAFFIFFLIYLLTIRDMHLKTGYPGAIQARYFFGFLPVCSLVIAKVMAYLSNRIINVIATLVMTAGLITATYPATVKIFDLRMWQSMTIVEQPLFNTNYGYLTSGRTFEQTIVAGTDTLRGVELMLATYARQNHGPLTLTLLERSGKAIASQTIRMETLKDNAYAWFDFNRVKIIKNAHYVLRLTCAECTPDNAITWWALKQEFEAPVFLLNRFGPGVVDKYPQGEARVDGTKVGGPYSFRLYFQ